MLKIIELASCESTNDEAWKNFDRTNPIAVLTAIQTKGRGRMGRQWNSDFTFSIACPFPKAMQSWIPLAVGASLYEVISKITPNFNNDRFWIKWPNDIYTGDAKCAGILCESKSNSDTPLGLIVGIGLNLYSAPKIVDRKTASIFSTAKSENNDLKNYFILTFWDILQNYFNLLNSSNVLSLKENWLNYANFKKYGKIKAHIEQNELIEIECLDLNDRGNLICNIYDFNTKTKNRSELTQPFDALF